MKKLKSHTVDWSQIERFLASADKKLASAHKILAFDEEACLQQAYEAMLKASLGFMFSHGFRARSQPGHHIAIIEFVQSRIDKKYSSLLTMFDRLRRKRNLALYDDTAFVSHHDAEEALKVAGEYLNVMQADIATRKNQPQRLHRTGIRLKTCSRTTSYAQVAVLYEVENCGRYRTRT
jgi:HEPN domain